jgi:ATP synthase F1 delta subunit
MHIKKMIAYQQLSKKYAQAYLNAFFDQCTITDYHAIAAACRSLKKNRRLIFFLTLSSIDPVVKALSVEQICKKYSLSSSIKKLLYLLLEKNRLFLIPQILEAIAFLYCKRAKLQLFHMSTSHSVTQNILDTLDKFLVCQTGQTIVCTHSIDTSLIAGVRLQSNDFLWEYSVRKSLRTVRLSLAR